MRVDYFLIIYFEVFHVKRTSDDKLEPINTCGERRSFFGVFLSSNINCPWRPYISNSVEAGGTVTYRPKGRRDIGYTQNSDERFCLRLCLRQSRHRPTDWINVPVARGAQQDSTAYLVENNWKTSRRYDRCHSRFVNLMSCLMYRNTKLWTWAISPPYLFTFSLLQRIVCWGSSWALYANTA